MKRRKFMVLVGGTAIAAWPGAARAQQAERSARIGYLSFNSAAQHARYSDAFRAGLRDLGYVEGKNFLIEFRSADGVDDRLQGLANDLVGLKVDVIVTYASGVPAAAHATATIPIVMATYGDPVATGIVGSLAHPNGNVTGLVSFIPELTAKRLELLKEAVPSLAHAGVLLFRDAPFNSSMLEALGDTARTLQVELQPINVRDPSEIEGAFSQWAKSQAVGVLVQDHPLFSAEAEQIAALAARYHIPSSGSPILAASGGLMAYGVNLVDQYRRAAVFVDKILKGTKPGDIPIERAAKFATIVNLKTAKALGITIPPSMLARVDEVIE